MSEQDVTLKDVEAAAEVLKGLYALKGNTLGGLTVPLTFTKGKPHSITCWFTTRIQNGVPKLVSTKDTCDKTAP
jgi:branched-chain amino acid transport system substrate-binding protein